MVSAWSSAPYWPMLYPAGYKAANFIKKVTVLPKSQQVVLPGRLEAVLPPSDILAVHFDFTLV